MNGEEKVIIIKKYDTKYSFKCEKYNVLTSQEGGRNLILKVCQLN